MESVNDQARVPAPPTTVHGARCFIILTFQSKLRVIVIPVRIQIAFDWTCKKATFSFMEDIFWLNLEILCNRSVNVSEQILDTHNTMTVLYHYISLAQQYSLGLRSMLGTLWASTMWMIFRQISNNYCGLRIIMKIINPKHLSTGFHMEQRREDVQDSSGGWNWVPVGGRADAELLENEGEKRTRTQELIKCKVRGRTVSTYLKV